MTSMNAILKMIGGLGLGLSFGAMGPCPMGSSSPTPVPTITPAATATPTPKPLLILTNNGAAVPAGSGVFGGVTTQTFVVGAVNKEVAIQFRATANVDLAYAVRDPNAHLLVPNATSGLVQYASVNFTPVVAGVYSLDTTAVTAIATGVTVNATVTQ